jgi:hypothetical protein
MLLERGVGGIGVLSLGELVRELGIPLVKRVVMCANGRFLI